jgi:arginine-tRNA-protein transferase
MSTIIRHFHALSPATLDEHLLHGWRTTGQAVYNCNFLRTDLGEMISVLPLRLELKDFSFSRSLRKLLRKNLRQFRVVYGPAALPDAEIRRVNEAYLTENPGKSLENIEYHVIGNYRQRVLNTWVCKVYKGSELVAFSYFDLGASAAYGKAGIYDPAYANASLGLFTMALEVEFCLRRNLLYYFPGYVSDDQPLFDYKHRIGKMDFYDLTISDWVPYGGSPRSQRPLMMIHEKLDAAKKYLAEASSLNSELKFYPHLDARYSSAGLNRYLDAPLFLLLKQTAVDRYHILVYELEYGGFRVWKVRESQFKMSYGSHSQDGIRKWGSALIVEQGLTEVDARLERVLDRYLGND